MKKIADFIVNHKIMIIIITLLLLIPSVIGYIKTKINYDILTYLPSDIETLKGENILTNDFNSGAFSIVITDNLKQNEITSLEEDIRGVDGVEKVISITDLTGNNIPVEVLPKKIRDKFSKDNEVLILVIFKNSTSDDETLNAVEEIKTLTRNKAIVGGMSTMVLDTKELFNSEMVLYVFIAVVFCIVILEISLDSYLIPFLLIGNIGIAIIFNMGSNIIFGNISYITKAIVAILQLGVTTDFSIFLYHKYESLKENEKDRNKAMSQAIVATFKSVAGSSLTTIAGFLALCTMELTLGVDIGLVMAKGVLLGVICVLTLFPALLLLFDKQIEKTKHKKILPKFDKINQFVIKYYKVIFVIFIILLIPAYLAQSKTGVYYKLDTSIPDDYDYSISTKKLKEDYGLVTEEMILIDKNIPSYKINEMNDKIKSLDGIGFVLSLDSLSKYGITENILPENLVNSLESDKYKMIIIGSDYDIATDELNNQITKINKIIKSYDKKAILAGEGPLMKDLVNTTNTDFINVNYTSIAVIFILMLIVLKSISLPVLLVTTIEFAIFLNMGIPYFTGTDIPFIASIVLGTIQLGATIDYAILLTTKYLEEKENGKDKLAAIKEAMNSSVESIFVSAMCFFGATIGVGIISQIDLIGSLCRLISRGAIISMLVVILVIPSILLIFDKLIMKTTLLKRKEEIKMKNNKSKKIVASLLLLSILVYPLNILALEKEETVYAKLNPDGTNKNTIVNEHLLNKDKTDVIEDLTDLDGIVNINSADTFSKDGEKITWQSDGKDIFFQGKTDKALPIKEEIKYKLDGQDITLDKLLGKKGNVEIIIKYINNSKSYSLVNGKNTLLYTPFTIATVTNFSNENNTKIDVTNGKVIDNGLGYTIVALSMPGLYESLNLKELNGFDEVKISIETEKFELPTIYSVATPKLVDIEEYDLFNKIDNMYKDIDKLENAMNELQKGSNTILNNLELVSNGEEQINENLKLVVDNLEKIKNGTIELDEGLTTILNELNKSKDDFAKMNSKLESINTLINGNTNYINGLNNIKTNYEKLSSVPVEYLTEEQKIQLQTLKFVYDNFNLGNDNTSLITVLSMDNNALNEMLTAFKEVNDAINKLNTYLPLLKNGADELSTGTTKIKEGTSLLSSKMNELSNGTKELKNGMNSFNNGLSKFNKNGIMNIINVKNKASDLTGRVKALDKLSNDYQSFSLKGNNTKSSTKFISITEGKEAPIKEKKVEVKETKESFWDRVVNLFK